MTDENKKKTVLGITENLEALLCYSVGWVSGLVFLLLEKDSQYVRFHALQSLATFLGLTIAGAVVSVIPVLGVLIAVLLWPLSVVLWIVLMVKAYQGEKFKLPQIGDFVEKQLGTKA